jgi:hypothetical protein
MIPSEYNTQSIVKDQSQIFKENIPKEQLFSLLKSICFFKDPASFFLDKPSYKRGIFTGEVPIFLEKCKPYYYLSKQSYLERPINYNNFATIIRQICKSHGIPIERKVSYDKSQHQLTYSIQYIH